MRDYLAIVLLLGSPFVAAAAAGPQAQAAQAAQSPPQFRIEIVVTPERGETPKASVPVATSVLDTATIPTLPAAHLSEMMPFITGFVTARSEFHAGRPIVSARGFFGGGEAEYLVLLIDGVPVADVESGLIDWSLVPASSLTRLEASRGPGSSLYGDSAVGGVVQVLTNRDRTGGRLTLAGGSFATLTGDGSYGRRRSGLSFDVSGAARTTHGAYEHSAGEQFGGTGSVDGRFGGFTWRWHALANHHERDDPGVLTRDQFRADPAASAPAYRFDLTDRRAQSTAFTMRHDSPRWRPQLRVYAGVRDEDSVRTILLAPNFGERYARELGTTAIGGSLEGEHRLATSRPMLMRFGLDLSRESLDSTYRFVGPTGAIGDVADGANGRRLRSGAFVSAAWETAPRVRLAAALRWDGVDDGGFGDPASGAPSEDAWSPRAGIVVRANDAGTISLFGQVSRAFKMPTLDQLFDVRPFPDFRGGTLTLSNPHLQPQRATNVEAGVSGGGARLSWSAVAYRMTVTNEIDFDVRTFSYANIGRSRHTGFEFETEGRWWSRVRPSASYAISRAVDADTNTQLKNVPRHVAAVGANVDLWWTVGVYARYYRTSGAYLDDDNAFPIDGPSRLDVRVRRPVGRHMAYLDVYNAANDQYEEYGFTLNDFAGRVVPYVYPGAGAAVRGGFTLSF